MIEPRIHKYDTVESTNDIALKMAKCGEPEGTVVTALEQTKGRGRRGRIWHGQSGQSLLMSVLLSPEISSHCLPQLSFVASLSVLNCLIAKSCKEVYLKWPNDVLVHDKKIAGILLETCSTKKGPAAVIGIGLNVNQSSFPEDISDIATSLFIETGIERSIDNVSNSLLAALFENYNAYLSKGFEEILGQWRKYMWGIGRQANIQSEEQTLIGRIDDIRPNGALVILDNGGTSHDVYAADSINLL